MAPPNGRIETAGIQLEDDDSQEIRDLQKELDLGGVNGICTIKNSPYFTLETLVRQFTDNPLIQKPVQRKDKNLDAEQLEKLNKKTMDDYKRFLGGLSVNGVIPILYNTVEVEAGEGNEDKDKIQKRKYLTFLVKDSIQKKNVTTGALEVCKRTPWEFTINLEDTILPFLKERIKTRIKEVDKDYTVMDNVPEIDFRFNEKERLKEILENLNIADYTQRGSEFILVSEKTFGKLEKLFLDPEERRQYLQTFDEETSALEVFYAVLPTAIRERASDIHIEPLSESKCRIRYRVDGVLHEAQHMIPNETLKKLISAIKAKANMQIEETRKPQDGSIIFGHNYIVDEERLKEGQKKTQIDMEKLRRERELELTRDKNFLGYSLRISTMPTDFGEKMVLRIQETGKKFELENLGLPKEIYSKLEQQLEAPDGIMYITGPTGSGKTTTIYAVLSKLNTKEVNIVTIEDPIEKNIEGLNQSRIQRKIGWDFAQCLRTYLRQDPDIIFIGELRDLETAELAHESSKTGHPVWTTLHTNDSIYTLLRLMDLGVQNYDLQACFRGAMAQRLIRLACTHCSEQYDARNDLNKLVGKEIFTEPILGVRDFKFNEKIKNKTNNTCPHCEGYGYKGRTMIAELWIPDDEEKQLIYEGCKNYQLYLNKAVEKGMKPLIISGVELFLQGKTTIPELLGTIPREEFIKRRDMIANYVRNFKK